MFSEIESFLSSHNTPSALSEEDLNHFIGFFEKVTGHTDISDNEFNTFLKNPELIALVARNLSDASVYKNAFFDALKERGEALVALSPDALASKQGAGFLRSHLTYLCKFPQEKEVCALGYIQYAEQLFEEAKSVVSSEEKKKRFDVVKLIVAEVFSVCIQRISTDAELHRHIRALAASVLTTKPLEEAVLNKSLYAIATLFISRGDIFCSDKNDPGKNNLLHLIARHNPDVLAELLKDNIGDTAEGVIESAASAQNAEGETPLHILARGSVSRRWVIHPNVSGKNLLVKAAIQKKNTAGDTPLHVLSRMKDIHDDKILHLIANTGLKRGELAKAFREQDANQNTPLHLLMQGGASQERVNLLNYLFTQNNMLEKDVFTLMALKNEQGSSVLYCAKKYQALLDREQRDSTLSEDSAAAQFSVRKGYAAQAVDILSLEYKKYEKDCQEKQAEQLRWEAHQNELEAYRNKEAALMKEASEEAARAAEADTARERMIQSDLENKNKVDRGKNNTSSAENVDIGAGAVDADNAALYTREKVNNNSVPVVDLFPRQTRGTRDVAEGAEFFTSARRNSKGVHEDGTEATPNKFILALKLVPPTLRYGFWVVVTWVQNLFGDSQAYENAKKAFQSNVSQKWNPISTRVEETGLALGEHSAIPESTYTVRQEELGSTDENANNAASRNDTSVGAAEEEAFHTPPSTPPAHRKPTLGGGAS